MIRVVAFRFSHRRRELIGLFPRNRDDAVPFAGELTSDAQAQSAASAGYDDVTHGWRTILPVAATGRVANEVDRRRHLMPGKRFTAELQDLVLEIAGMLRWSWRASERRRRPPAHR